MADRVKYAVVRQQVIEMIRKDLLGPLDENEVLNQNPRFEYLVGMLAPQVDENGGDSNEQEVDGDAAFDGDAKAVVRTAELDKNDDLTITDHIVCGEKPSVVEWRMATNAETQIVAPNTIMLRQDGKTLYLKFKGKVKAEAKIWPDHKYREYEIVDKNLRRVGFVMQMKANQRVDIEVKMSGERD